MLGPEIGGIDDGLGAMEVSSSWTCGGEYVVFDVELVPIDCGVRPEDGPRDELLLSDIS